MRVSPPRRASLPLPCSSGRWVARARAVAALGALGSAAAWAGCTTPLPVLELDAATRDDAPGLDAPVLPPDAPELDAEPLPDAPGAPDAPAVLDAPGAVGAACAADRDCAAGSCVDGVCCASPCAGVCMACAAALTGAADGTCAPVSAGTDPGDECVATPPTGCGTDGACDGAGACALHRAGTTCSSGSCSSPSSAIPARLCDGAGTCLPAGGAVDCGAYRCRGGVCPTSCVGGADCAAGADCSPMGVCQGIRRLGDGCGRASECASGFCVDGRCCDSACTGLCRRCDGNGTAAPAGTCSPIECSDPDDECSGLLPVCSGGVCGTTPIC